GHDANRAVAMKPLGNFQGGFSLIELLIAVAIGLLLLTVLTYVFVHSSTGQRQVQVAAQQIENGRYSVEMLIQDVHLAGFYGQYSQYADSTTAPDPCLTAAASLQAGLRSPVQSVTALQTTSGIPTVYPD